MKSPLFLWGNYVNRSSKYDDSENSAKPYLLLLYAVRRTITLPHTDFRPFFPACLIFCKPLNSIV